QTQAQHHPVQQVMTQQLQLRSRQLEEVRECRRLLRVLPGAAEVSADGPLASETGQMKVVQQAAAYIDQLHRELLTRMFPFAGDARGVQTLMESLLPPAFFTAALLSPRRCRASPEASASTGRGRLRRRRVSVVRSQRRPRQSSLRTTRPKRPSSKRLLSRCSGNASL
ncbi:hypothetical protein BOX15_Mlig017600g1, partial [Macrostomum lignano]